MEIQRKYKKPSRHKHWRIHLIINFHDESPVIELYGFSSKNEPQRKFTSLFEYVSDSREDALSKEQELIDRLHKHIDDSIEKQIKRIEEQVKYSNKTILKWEKFYEIPEIKGIKRDEKLEEIFQRK